MTSQKQSAVLALQWTGNSLKVLDQRQLPDTISYDEYTDAQGVAEAIAAMQVRGAPAIGIAAAYGVALSVSQMPLGDSVSGPISPHSLTPGQRRLTCFGH
jgi:methylthioribose-1-phosphate isomerase